MRVRGSREGERRAGHGVKLSRRAVVRFFTPAGVKGTPGGVKLTPGGMEKLQLWEVSGKFRKSFPQY